MKINKQKRIPLSMIRIYRLATRYLTQPSRLEEKDRKKLTPDIIISDFLKYTFEHKNDIL